MDLRSDIVAWLQRIEVLACCKMILASQRATRSNDFVGLRKVNEFQNLDCTNIPISSSCVRYTTPLGMFSLVQPREDPSTLLRDRYRRRTLDFTKPHLPTVLGER